MGVGVEGGRDIGVAESFLDDFGMGAVTESQCGPCVTEVVKSDVRQPRLFGETVESPGYPVRFDHQR